MTRLRRAVLAAAASIATISGLCPALAQTPAEQQKINEMRRLFHYGMELVEPCRYFGHDGVRLTACMLRLVFPPPRAEVNKWVNAGANYQRLIFALNGGIDWMVPGTFVRSDVDDLFRGHAEYYCAVFDVDCAPVVQNIANWNATVPSARIIPH